jgi:hypothetical protein
MAWPDIEWNSGVKITALVRFFNHVRSQLQTGLALDEIEPFKQQVKKIVVGAVELP